MGVDIKGESLELARENAKLCKLEDRVKFKKSDWFSEVEGEFDWIISNPPYLTEAEWGSSQPEVHDFEPKEALVASEEGLADLLKILDEAREYLVPNGGIALETVIAHHGRLEEVAKSLGYEAIESWKDLNGRNRFFIAQKI